MWQQFSTNPPHGKEDVGQDISLTRWQGLPAHLLESERNTKKEYTTTMPRFEIYTIPTRLEDQFPAT
jgi:hypothetical protein